MRGAAAREDAELASPPNVSWRAPSVAGRHRRRDRRRRRPPRHRASGPRASARRLRCRPGRGSGPGPGTAREPPGSRAGRRYATNANRPAGSSNGWASGGWSVRRRDGRRRWTRALVVSMVPRPSAGRVVAERGHRPIALEAAVGQQPGDAPTEAGDAVPLEALRERPQLVEAEGRGRSGDELLAHRADHRLRPNAG